MADFTGPYGVIRVPDSTPPVQALREYGNLAPLMDWAAALQQTFETLQGRPRPAYLRFTGYGLLNEAYDGAPGLGVILYCDDVGQDSGVLGSVQIDDFQFPIVLRRVRSESQAAAPGLPGGTPTCWARSRRVGDGFLTAKHVLPSPGRPPLQVRLRTGGYANLIDLAPECFDAALLSHAIDTTNPLQSNWDVALTQTVEVNVPGGSFTASVSSVMDPRGSWATTRPLPVISLRFLVSSTGQPGDSGALVHKPMPPHGSGDGLGIYLGEFDITTASGTFTEGYCQHLEQIAQLMELDLFRI